MAWGIFIAFMIVLAAGPTVLRAALEWRQELRSEQWESGELLRGCPEEEEK